MATCGSTPRRLPRWRRATPTARCTSARSPKFWRPACAWATWWRPKALYPKLLQAKQAADLHTPSFNQRIVSEVLKNGFIDRHVPTIRALYKQQCAAMLAALDREMAGLDFTFNRPAGGMFLWARLPAGVDAVGLLPKAVEKNVAFVPGAAFYADHADPRTLRLSFVTASVDQINTGIAALAQAIREYRG